MSVGGWAYCLICDILGIKIIFLHPYVKILSTYGIVLADIYMIQEKYVEQLLNQELVSQLSILSNELEIKDN